MKQNIILSNKQVIFQEKLQVKCNRQYRRIGVKGCESLNCEREDGEVWIHGGEEERYFRQDKGVCKGWE